MAVPEEQKGATPIENQPVSSSHEAADTTASASGTDIVSYSQTTDHDQASDYHSGYDHSYEDPYSGQSYPPATAEAAGGSSTPPPSTPPADEEGDDDDGMLRMSFLEHLEELRNRIIRILIGVGIAFAVSLVFADIMWKAISEPAAVALAALGYPPTLKQLTPMDAFTTIYMKLPLLAATFLSSPWVLWQIWGFVAPGLYKKERRFAGPLVISSAGLFVLGGLFAYFVAFRFGLEFLLGIGRDINVEPAINMVDYFDLFVNVTLGIGIVFELPVVIFFLSLLKIVSARFLVEHSRYAILIIVILAALITPTPDVFNLMLFSVPMVVLYFVGVFAAYLLELRRDEKSFPWLSILVILTAILGISGGLIWALVAKYGYKLVSHWPFLIR